MLSEMVEDNLDVHLCLNCQLKMVGLDNYIRHKKVECPSLTARMTLSHIGNSIGQSGKSEEGTLLIDSHADSYDLRASKALVLCFPSISDEPITGSGIGQCGLNLCADSETAENTSTAAVSDDESAVDSFFESLQLRSRYGPGQPNICRTGYYSGLFEHHIDQPSFGELAREDVIRGDNQAPNVASLGVCSSLTDIKCSIDGSDMFSHSDSEDLLSFSVEDMNACQSCAEPDKSDYYVEMPLTENQVGEKELPVVVNSKASLDDRVPLPPEKWFTGKRMKGKFLQHSEISDVGLSSCKRNDERQGKTINSVHQCENSTECATSSYISYESSSVGGLGGVKKLLNKVAKQTFDGAVDRSVRVTQNEGNYREHCKSRVNETSAQSHIQSDCAQSFECTACNVVLRTKYSLARHLVTGLHKRRVKGFCKQSTAQSPAVDDDCFLDDTRLRNLVQKQRSFQCRACLFYADRKDDLLQHLLTDEHSNSTQHLTLRCVRCRFVAQPGAEMLAHLKSAAHDSVASSSAGCCILRKQRPQMAKPHVKTVSSGFSCEHCSASFKSKCSLTVHTRRKHTREKPFVCLNCSKSFTDNSSLSVHLKSVRHRRLAAVSAS